MIELKTKLLLQTIQGRFDSPSNGGSDNSPVTFNILYYGVIYVSIIGGIGVEIVSGSGSEIAFFQVLLELGEGRTLIHNVLYRIQRLEMIKKLTSVELFTVGAFFSFWFLPRERCRLLYTAFDSQQ